MNLAKKLLLGTFATGYALSSASEKEQCFIYRDDIGAYWGIKGYEEQVSEVGTHKGHVSWPQFRHFGTYDSGSVRRGIFFVLVLVKLLRLFCLFVFLIVGFQVFTKNCANCHGMMAKKYDLLLTKAYEQLELASWVAEHFTIHPAHHHYKQYYYQEWDDRDR